MLLYAITEGMVPVIARFGVQNEIKKAFRLQPKGFRFLISSLHHLPILRGPGCLVTGATPLPMPRHLSHMAKGFVEINTSTGSREVAPQPRQSYAKVRPKSDAQNLSKIIDPLEYLENAAQTPAIIVRLTWR